MESEMHRMEHLALFFLGFKVLKALKVLKVFNSN